MMPPTRLARAMMEQLAAKATTTMICQIENRNRFEARRLGLALTPGWEGRLLK